MFLIWLCLLLTNAAAVEEIEIVTKPTTAEPAVKITSKAAPVFQKSSKAVPVVETTSKAAPVDKRINKAGPVVETTSEVKSVVETTSEVKPVVETTSKAGPVVETTSKAGPENETSSKAGPENETSSKAGPENETSSKAGPENETSSKAGSENETSSKAGPVVETTSKPTLVVETTSKPTLVVEAKSTKATTVTETFHNRGGKFVTQRPIGSVNETFHNRQKEPVTSRPTEGEEEAIVITGQLTYYGPPRTFPSPSCAVVHVRDKTIMDGTKPILATSTFDVSNQSFEDGIPYTISLKKKPVHYWFPFSLDATINLGWCRSESVTEWIRTGDFLNTRSHRLKLRHQRNTYSKDIQLVCYECE